MQNLLNELTDLLQADQVFISDGAVLKHAVTEHSSPGGGGVFSNEPPASMSFKNTFESLLEDSAP